MILLLNQKPDTSLAQKSGHFYLLKTLTEPTIHSELRAALYGRPFKLDIERDMNAGRCADPLTFSNTLGPLLETLRSNV